MRMREWPLIGLPFRSIHWMRTSRRNETQSLLQWSLIFTLFIMYCALEGGINNMNLPKLITSEKNWSHALDWKRSLLSVPLLSFGRTSDVVPNSRMSCSMSGWETLGERLFPSGTNSFGRKRHGWQLSRVRLPNPMFFPINVGLTFRLRSILKNLKG